MKPDCGSMRVTDSSSMKSQIIMSNLLKSTKGSNKLRRPLVTPAAHSPRITRSFRAFRLEELAMIAFLSQDRERLVAVAAVIAAIPALLDLLQRADSRGFRHKVGGAYFL